MIIDLDQSVTSLPKTWDFCVVGAGPAGITLALELGDYGRSVIVLEGGGFDAGTDSQEIYSGDVIGDRYWDLDNTRLRYLGGSSDHWDGWCAQLGDFDFQKKEGFENAYWPIEKRDLDPFLEKALFILDISQPLNAVVLDREFGIKETFISKSKVAFGKKFRERLNSSKNVTCVLNANLTGLKTTGPRIVSASATNFAGQSVSVKARHFILAMGGIENSRMLMWCNAQANGKIVDPRAPLGRYWMEHPAFKAGEGLLDLKMVTLDRYPYPRRIIGLTEAAKKKLSILECRIIIKEIPGGDTTNLLRDLLCVAPNVGERIARRVGKKLMCGAVFGAEWEQEPIWNNCVKLSETKRDRFGIPLTELHWKKTDQDLATVQKSLSQFNDYVMARNRGRIKFFDWVVRREGFPEYDPMSDDEGASYHHMGGTRMASTVTNGVVDSNCRVFGQENLYVAGSSVFPSGGAVNPTLTIVQLALRLAGRLRNA